MKSKILKLAIEVLKAQTEASIQEALSAKEAANHEESKPENKYDTRGLEASYMAQAQAKRVTQLKEDLFNLSQFQLPQENQEHIGLGSLVEVLYESGKSLNLFILPVGGLLVDFNQKKIKSLNLKSPLGKALFNLSEGDEIKLNGEHIEILNVS